MAWTDGQGLESGMLTLTVILDGPDGFADGDYASERLDVAEGEAFLQWVNDGTDAEQNRFLEVAWRRGNGDVWKFMSNGLSPNRLVDVVQQVGAGSGLPVIAPESGMQLTAIVDSSGTGMVRTQESSLADEYVSISVRNDGRAFGQVVKGDEIRPATIAGAAGFVATLRNGQVDAVWDASDGWWATLTIGPALASRADEILGSIVSTGVEIPDTEQRFDVSLEIPAGSIDEGPNDVFILHDDGDLYWHRNILAGDSTDSVRLADLGDPRLPVSEGPGPNGVDHVAGVVNGILIYGDCCEPISGNLLAATGPDSDRIVLGAGYSPTFSPNQRLLATANDYAIVVIDIAGRHGEGLAVNQSGDSYRNVADAMWASDDQLVVLFWDDSGYQLLPIDITSMRPGEPVAIGATFDPNAFGTVRFAGTSTTGELVLTTSQADFVRLRFFDPITLTETEELERRLPAQSTSVRIDQTGERVLYINNATLIYDDGETVHEIGDNYLAAWFAT